MPTVQTVTGPRDPATLGRTAMHEHLLFGLPGWTENPLINWDRAASIQRGVEYLQRAKGAGLGALVDATAIGVTRDIAYLREVSEKAEFPIVFSTGWWLIVGMQQHFSGATVEMLRDIMIHELTKEVRGTGVRAGIIKVASSRDEMHEAEAKVIAAAGQAQAATGCAVTTHTSGSTLGEEQIAILLKNGAAPEKLIIGHSDDRGDIDYHRRLLSHGVTVEFDHIGVGEPRSLSDETKAQMVATLVNEGFAKQLTLSLDSVLDLPDRPEALGDSMREPAHLMTKFVPLMRAAGVSEDDIDQMLVRNPARLLPF